MSTFLIPLIAAPQAISVTLGGVTYQLTFLYRNVDQGGWTIDIADSSGNAVLSGVPMVTGVDLLAQYAYLGFGGALYVQTTTDPTAIPTFQNLGQDCFLYWVTP